MSCWAGFVHDFDLHVTYHFFLEKGQYCLNLHGVVGSLEVYEHIAERNRVTSCNCITTRTW